MTVIRPITEVSFAQVEIAKARLERAMQDLEDTKVYAPFAGRMDLRA